MSDVSSPTLTMTTNTTAVPPYGQQQGYYNDKTAGGAVAELPQYADRRAEMRSGPATPLGFGQQPVEKDAGSVSVGVVSELPGQRWSKYSN
jgi:hypothetical protein